jgi:hypothetical protein
VQGASLCACAGILTASVGVQMGVQKYGKQRLYYDVFAIANFKF